jgi:phage gp16-like protein
MKAAGLSSVGDRRNDLAKIHVAKKALGWDDSTYRDILWTVCRVKSASELDTAGRRAFLDHLAKCGWSSATKSSTSPSNAVRAPLTPTQKKMWAMWQKLADAGKVENRKMPALVAFVQRTVHVDRLEWLTWPQESLVLEALKKWLDRKPGGSA